jgi:hypothetical protein
MAQPLSALTQYHFRKLVQEYGQSTLHLAPHFLGVRLKTQDDLQTVLFRLYPESSEYGAVYQQMETLLEAYQFLREHPDHQANLVTVKQRIWLLLKLDPETSRDLDRPELLPEEQFQLFMFYRDVELTQGLCHGQDLYGLVASFAPQHRLQLYQVSHALRASQLPMVVTVSPERYGIWLSLRSPSYRVLANRKFDTLKLVANCYSQLNRFQHRCKGSEARDQAKLFHAA